MVGPGPTNFLPPFTVGGIPTQGIGGAPLFTGNWYFVDAVDGSDGNTGAANQPLATVYRALSKCTAGNNDVVVIVGNGGTTGTQRLSLANAQATDSTVTAGTLVWNKNATHLIGMTAPTIAARARFAPPSGTYTQATFGSGNFVTVSAQGCYFANFSLFNGFSTGGVNQICWTDSGGRNYYSNVDFGGCGDAASAADTGSMSLLLSGSTGENHFDGCSFGLDTVSRGVANATVQATGGSPRNVFNGCSFKMLASAATPMHINIPAAGIDRFMLLNDCQLLNAVDSTGTALNAAIIANAAAGGSVVMNGGISLGATAVATTGPVYVNGAVPTATTSSIAIKAT